MRRQPDEAEGVNFGALPPEINSTRMYSGPGSGPMLAAAAAWDGVAAELRSTASSYDSVISGLTGAAWSGPAAASMSAAAEPFAAWLSTSAAQSEESAVRARAAAAAYDAAFTATVPPPVVAANRSLLMSLIATNIFGQNAAAIAAAELQYAEMWAQDAAVMYGYAGASASAAALTPFAAPPPTTSLAGLPAQAAAAGHATAGAGTQLSQLMSMLPQALQSMAVSGPSAAAAPAQVFPILDALAGPLSPISLFGIAGVPYLLAIQLILLPMNGANVVASVARAQGPKPWLEEPAAGLAEAGAGNRLVGSPMPAGSGVSAGLGNANSIGRLSVPHGWVASTTTAKTVAAVFPEAGAEAVSMVAVEGETGLLNNLALGGLAGRAIGATGGAASRSVGGATGLAAASKPTKASKATIIVIPPSAEDR